MFQFYQLVNDVNHIKPFFVDTSKLFQIHKFNKTNIVKVAHLSENGGWNYSFRYCASDSHNYLVRERQYFMNKFYFVHLKNLYVRTSKLLTYLKYLYRHPNYAGEHRYGEADSLTLGISFCEKQLNNVVLTFSSWFRYGDLFTTILPSLLLLPEEVVRKSVLLLCNHFNFDMIHSILNSLYIRMNILKEERDEIFFVRNIY